jgi:hypothetical protein
VHYLRPFLSYSLGTSYDAANVFHGVASLRGIPPTKRHHICRRDGDSMENSFENDAREGIYRLLAALSFVEQDKIQLVTIKNCSKDAKFLSLSQN